MELTPGVLDGSAENAFSYGACGGLAIALHEAAGWPLIKVTDADSVYTDDGLPFDALDELERAERIGNAGDGAGGIHWLVRRPDGMLIDIDGAHTIAEVFHQWDGTGGGDDGSIAIGITTLDDAMEEYVTAKGEPVALTMCRTFVGPVLERTNAR